jgi:hypothetical protein
MTPAAKRDTALFCLVTAIFMVAFVAFLQIQPRSDLNTHLGYAQRIQSLSDITSPHFLFEILVKLLIAAGLTPVVACGLLLGACYGGMAVLIAREIEQRGAALTPVRTFLVVPALLLASHIFLLTLARHNLYYGYFTPIVYHNPTQQLGKLFAVWIWFRFCRQFVEGSSPAAWTHASVTGALCVLSALAKPSFLIAFLPVGACVALVDLVRGRRTRALQFGGAIALPSAAVLLWQGLVAYGAGLTSEVIFAPFAVFDAWQTVFKLPASLAFPLVIVVMAWRERGWHPRLGWTGLFLAIALFQTLFLAEAGNVGAGNFAWTGQTAVFLAYVESALFLLGRTWPAGWRYAGWSVFAVHVACGVIWYAAGFFPERASFL